MKGRLQWNYLVGEFLNVTLVSEDCCSVLKMINLELALGSFWQLARHWKMGDTAKLELSCEGGNLQLNFSAKLGHPDNQHFQKEELPTSSTPPPSTSPPASCKRKTPSQLRRQDRRRLAALDKAASVQAALDKVTANIWYMLDPCTLSYIWWRGRHALVCIRLLIHQGCPWERFLGWTLDITGVDIFSIKLVSC